jgi:hypothetical protein
MKHGRYLFFQFKKDLPFCFLLFGIELLSLAVMMITNRSVGAEDYFATSFLIYGVIFAFLMAYVYPLVHKAKFFSKRSTDLYLSLPLSKKGIYRDDALLGLGELLLLFTLFYSLGLLLAPLTSGKWIGAVWAGYFFLYGLLGILTGYGFGLGISSCANNILDAVIFLVLALIAMFGFSALFASLRSYYSSTTKDTSYSLIFTFDSMGFPPAALAKGLVDRTLDSRMEYAEEKLPLYINFIHLAIALLYAVAGYFLSAKWQAEKSQTPSLSWYGYPLHTALALTFYLGIDGENLGKNDTTTLLVVFCIGTLLFAIVYFIGQRKIRLSWSLLISYVASVFFGYGFAAILIVIFSQLQQGNVH